MSSQTNTDQRSSDGNACFGASLASKIATLFSGKRPISVPFPELTERERSVLEMLAAGRSNAEIASQMYVSDKTVRNAVSGIYLKLHATGRADAIVKAREAGFGRG